MLHIKSGSDQMKMQNTVFTVTGKDGVGFDARICVPEGEPRGVVIFLKGSGAMTYLTKIEKKGVGIVSYHDAFASLFAGKNIAYVSYSTRGVTDSDDPPDFHEIDEVLYKTYTPQSSVEDVLCLIDRIKMTVPGKPILLLGGSEGTVIAPLVALRCPEVTGLLLFGYVNDNLLDLVRWQYAGGSTMTLYRRHFDLDRKGYITSKDYKAGIRSFYEKYPQFPKKKFKELDVDGDGKLTAPDLAAAYGQKRYCDEVFKAIAREDDEWFRLYFPLRLTAAWFKGHALMEPNSAVLPRVDIPIFIFRGEYDESIPEENVRAIEKRFTELGKTNLTVYYFKDTDHGLNMGAYLRTGDLEACEGLKCLIDTADRLLPD